LQEYGVTKVDILWIDYTLNDWEDKHYANYTAVADTLMGLDNDVWFDCNLMDSLLNFFVNYTQSNRWTPRLGITTKDLEWTTDVEQRDYWVFIPTVRKEKFGPIKIKFWL